MDSHKKLLLANRAWVQDKLNVRADYFQRMAQDQTPEFLWIGCSDSRVPAEDITGTEPGELFVHRNIANLCLHTDFNMLSVVQYAVEVLEVKHVIVCGHYGCGGVKNAMTHKDLGGINRWLHEIKDVYHAHAAELESIPDLDRRTNRLVELNVVEQLNNLSHASTIQSAWKKRKSPILHGWVYDLATGYLNDLAELTHESRLDDIYRLDVD